MSEFLSLYKGVVGKPQSNINMVSRYYLPHTLVDSVLKAIAALHEVTVADLLGQSRERRIAHPRQEAMYLLRSVMAPDGRPKYSLPDIGRAIGGRDHTTVLHGVRAHAARSRVDDRNCRITPAQEAA